MTWANHWALSLGVRFCVLKSPNGHMEGEYRFLRSDETRFDAVIPRFTLAADEWLSSQN